jgi:hypothetical protein
MKCVTVRHSGHVRSACARAASTQRGRTVGGCGGCSRMGASAEGLRKPHLLARRIATTAPAMALRRPPNTATFTQRGCQQRCRTWEYAVRARTLRSSQTPRCCHTTPGLQPPHQLPPAPSPQRTDSTSASPLARQPRMQARQKACEQSSSPKRRCPGSGLESTLRPGWGASRRTTGTSVRDTHTPRYARGCLLAMVGVRGCEWTEPTQKSITHAL